MNSAGNITTYLRHQKGSLILITITGLIYNIGMIAGPWFEGQLVQTLADILDGNKTLADMIVLAGIYVLTILCLYRSCVSSSVCMYVNLPITSTKR